MNKVKELVKKDLSFKVSEVDSESIVIVGTPSKNLSAGKRKNRNYYEIQFACFDDETIDRFENIKISAYRFRSLRKRHLLDKFIEFFIRQSLKENR